MAFFYLELALLRFGNNRVGKPFLPQEHFQIAIVAII